VGLVRYGGLALVQILAGRRQEAALASLRLARSVGRLAWMRPFRRQRYGIIAPPAGAAVPAEISH
jgi:hypothetical protein